ncbi:MAG: hypothetical protein JNL21_34655 [Myxococcales bacterium]|nr:hypothetical protein [Myxococcales bacterium]
MRHLALALVLVACSSKDPAPSASSSSKPASAPPPTATSASEPRPPADHLDVEPIKKALKCPAESKSGPCKILDAVATCGPWEGTSPGGEAKWLGHSWDVKDGKQKDGYAVLRSRTVPLDQASGGIPARIGFDQVPEDLPSMLGIQKAVSAFERHDVAQKGNAGLAWVKDKKDFSEAPAFATTKKGVLVQSDDFAYVCQGKSQELFYARPRAGGAAKGDGVYAELWPVSW